MKHAFLFSLILLMVVSPSLFAGGQKEGSTKAEPVTLEFLNEGTPGDVESGLYAEFSASHPNIKLEVIPFPGEATDYETKILTSMAAGDAPDIFTTHDNTTYRYAVDKLILPVPDDLADYIRKEAPPAIKDGMLYPLTVEGEIYAAPWNADWVCLFWNKDMFAEAGLPGAPKTIDENTEYAIKLTKRDSSGTITRSGLSLRLTGHPAGIVDKFISHFTAFGGEMVSEDLRRPLFNDTPGKAAAQWYLDLLYKYKVDAVDIPHDAGAFFNNQTAMFGRGPWVVARYKETTPQMVYGTNYEIAVCPSGRAQARSIGFIDAIAVSKGAKHPNEAWDFVKWMVMDGERYARYQIAVGSVPLLMPVVKDPYYEGEGRFMKVFMNQPLWREPNQKHFYELKTKFGGYLERIFYQKMGLDEAFAKADAEAKEILARTY